MVTAVKKIRGERRDEKRERAKAKGKRKSNIKPLRLLLKKIGMID